MYEVGTKIRLDLPTEVRDALNWSADAPTHTVVGHDGQYLIIKPIRHIEFVPARESRITPDRVVVMDPVEGTCTEIEHDPSCPVSKGYVRVCTCKRDEQRLAAQDDPRGERDR